ncbi:MAG TPA: hypothetical protein VFC44_13435 [Candidatus Saccharimonadales bacterium]|nr:hypothetical protein [Candidatus Saccharimonadales bacterium]
MKTNKVKRWLVNCAAAIFCAAAMARAGESKSQVRVSAWYWLNSAPKADWRGDFTTMKNLGFTDVLLCWGLDLSGIVTRPTETKQAMQWAHQAGIGVYLIVWQPFANSLTRHPEFMQVDATGRQLATFDVFNPHWRETQWKSYLQDVAKNYGDDPAMSGYVFDDSFASGTVSYGAYEEKVFGGPLPRTPKDPRWNEWTKARQGWWEDWAKDTVDYIRSIDANPQHEIYLEDTIGRITNQKEQADIGLDFARVARHFDAVGGYTTPAWTSNLDSEEKVLDLTSNAIENVRRIVGSRKQIVYTFWSANISEEHKPGPAVYPSASQIQKVCEQALKMGVRHLDMYGYRIGNSGASREEMKRRVPAEPAPYILTGQFPQKFMWDRPEIHTDLGDYLRGLNLE